jgi:hypothetical protein
MFAATGRDSTLVAQSLGVDRKTVRKYVAPAEAAGFIPGGPPVTTEQWVALAQEWFPELLVPELRSAGFAECNGLHDRIKSGLATNTLSTVRVLRSSCNPRGRRLASSSHGREPQPGRCPSLWPGDLRNDGISVAAAGADGSET